MMGLKGFKPHGDFVVIELCEKKNSSSTSVADDDAPPF